MQAPEEPRTIPQLNPAPTPGQFYVVSVVVIDVLSQEYGTGYWTIVSDLGLLMESLANYLRYG